MSYECGTRETRLSLTLKLYVAWAAVTGDSGKGPSPVLSVTELAENDPTTAVNGPRASNMRRRAHSREQTHQNFPSCKGRREGVSPYIARALLTGSVSVPSVPFFSTGQPPGSGDMLELSLTNGCLMAKDNWLLGEAWPSTNMRNAPSSALAAFQILAVGGILLDKWKAPAT